MNNNDESVEFVENNEQSQNWPQSKWKAYKTYLESGSGLFLTFGLLILFILTQSSAVVTDYWVSIW
jgi:hypothetical protein